MKHFKYFLMALFIFTGFISIALAVDGDLYNDEHWRISSDGVMQPVNVTGQVAGIIRPNHLLTANKTATAEESGAVFIASHASVATTTEIFVTLPDCADGLEYTLITGGVSAKASFKPYDKNDIIKYLTLGGGDELESPAATGASVTLIGQNEAWFIKDMTGTWADGT